MFDYIHELKERLKYYYLSSKISIIPPSETIQQIVKGNSLSRFGDGEFNIMIGFGIDFQRFNPILQQRLIDTFSEKNDGLIIGIYDGINPKNLKCYKKSQKDWTKKHLKYMLPSYLKFIDLNRIYYSAYISRFWMPFKDKNYSRTIFKGLKGIWCNRDIIIVEGEKTRMGVGNDLFENAKSIKRILCPANDAFDKYNEILNACLRINKNRIFLIALGPTASVLAYDLHKNGYQAVDIGHMDIEYEWMRMGTNKRIKIKNKYVNEAENGNIVSDDDLDSCYFDQIITKIL